MNEYNIKFSCEDKIGELVDSSSSVRTYSRWVYVAIKGMRIFMKKDIDQLSAGFCIMHFTEKLLLHNRRPSIAILMRVRPSHSGNITFRN